VAAARAWGAQVKAAATALVGVQYALGGAIAAYAASAIVLSRRPGALALIFLLVAYVPYAGVGSILVARRPRNVIGWVLVGIGWTFAVGFLPIDATTHDLQTLTASPVQEAIVWLTEWCVSVTFALFALLAFSFPTGKLAIGRWRNLAALVLALIWALVIISAFWPVLTVEPRGGTGLVEIPNPIGLLPPRILGIGLPSQMAGTALLPFIMVASIVAMTGRYAGARALERLQLRWLAASFGLIAVAVPLGFVIWGLFDATGEISWVPASVAFMLPPIAIGVAVTRHRLYEIDRIISRTIGWAVVTSILATTFVTLVVGLQAALGSITQSRTPVVAVSTLVAFAVFQPVRRRVQAAVDHRFNRARYDADRLATAFADRLRDEVDLTAVSGDIAGVVDAALRPSAIGVWIRRSRPTTP
jgi:hypothetical protein